MLLARWFRGKKQTIQSSQGNLPPVVAPVVTLRDRLLQALEQCDIDALIQNPVAAMSLLTLYCGSCHELAQETLTPSRNKALIGVSLSSFFKDSHLPPSLVMARLAGLFTAEPVSNYARFDIDIIITELHDLSRSSSRLP